MSLFETDVGPRGVAVVKHRREPRPADPWSDLPFPADAELVLAGGLLGNASFRSSNGTKTVVRGEVRCVSLYAAERTLRWDPAHPRDAAVLRALRGLSGPWETGWRAATA